MLAVIKLGGNALTSGDEPILSDLLALREAGWRIVLVHGGGPDIDAALSIHGITTERVSGLRITDAQTLNVTEAALCGTVNKRIVRQCSQLGILAAGISGQDGATLIAQPLEAIDGMELGYVGEVRRVNTKLISALLEAGFLPVIAPLAIASDGRCAYNVNADIAAGMVAAAMRADSYIVITNVDYVLRDPSDPASAITSMTMQSACDFLANPACASGMKPKMESVISALRGGVTEAIICGAQSGALRGALQNGTGTRITD